MVHLVALTIGIILFVIAIIGYVAPIAGGMNVIELTSLCGDPWTLIGAVMMGMQEELAQECQNLGHLLFGIYVTGIVGIAFIIIGVAKKTTPEFKKYPGGYVCEHCNFIGKTEGELWDHYTDAHPDSKKW